MSFIDDIREIKNTQKVEVITEEYIFSVFENMIESAADVYLECIKCRIKEKAKTMTGGQISEQLYMENMQFEPNENIKKMAIALKDEVADRSYKNKYSGGRLEKRLYFEFGNNPKLYKFEYSGYNDYRTHFYENLKYYSDNSEDYPSTIAYANLERSIIEGYRSYIDFTVLLSYESRKVLKKGFIFSKETVEHYPNKALARFMELLKAKASKDGITIYGLQDEPLSFEYSFSF